MQGNNFRRTIVILFLFILCNSSSARYLQSDPIGLEGGINTYGYANQSPVMNVDPEGKLAGGIVAVWAGGCSLYAFKKAMSAQFDPNDPTPDDKKRHCMASCLITKCMLGLPAAPGIGIGKEIMDSLPGGTGFDMDDVRANNRGWGAGYDPTKDCQEKCDECSK